MTHDDRARGGGGVRSELPPRLRRAIPVASPFTRRSRVHVHIHMFTRPHTLPLSHFRPRVPFVCRPSPARAFALARPHPSFIPVSLRLRDQGLVPWRRLEAASTRRMCSHSSIGDRWRVRYRTSRPHTYPTRTPHTAHRHSDTRHAHGRQAVRCGSSICQRCSSTASCLSER